jgi:hypothetical protein
MTFEQDLELGGMVERGVLTLIRKKYPLAHRIEGYHKEFDLFVPEVRISVEVKFDRRAAETGNFIFETSSSGKPSGLKVTTADWWVQVDKKDICWIRTESLRHLIVQEEAAEISFFLDGREKTGFLLPKDIFRYSLFVVMGRIKECKSIPF